MIYWAKFEGTLFFDPECTGPLLQTLPLNFLSTGINKRWRQGGDGGIAAILNLAMSRGRASTNQTFFAGEGVVKHKQMVVARWNPSEGGDRGGLETRVASVIFGS